MMRILILNQHSSNFGDDAAGVALIRMLKKWENVDRIDIIYNADKEIPINDEIVFHNSEIKIRTAGYMNVLLYLIFSPLGFTGFNPIMKKWASIIRKADVVFVAPSGANIGIYKDWRFLLRILMAVRTGKTPVFHYNTIGVSGNIIFDSIAKYILSKSQIYVREEKTYEFVTKTLGLKCLMGPDTAFALDVIKSDVKQDRLSIVPSYFDSWHRNFVNNPVDEKILKELVPTIGQWAEKHNLTIQILPHLWTQQEISYNRKVYDAFVSSCSVKVIIRDDVKTMWEYDSAIAESRLVVGMRYHTVVLAAKNRRPFVSLSYENKMKEVCNYLKMNEFDLDLVGYARGKELGITKTLDEAYTRDEEICDRLSVIIESDIIPKVHIPTDNILGK